MSDSRKAEIIILHETALESWARDASTFALFVGLISIGWFLDSSALQWSGAVVAFVTVLSRAKLAHRISITQARQFLDEIEARQK